MKSALLGAIAGLLIIILASIADWHLYNREENEEDES